MNQRKTIVMACRDDKGVFGELSAHFGRCPHYLVATAIKGDVYSTSVVDNPHYAGHRPGQMPNFIKELGADVIVAGGMGPRAIDIFGQNGIEVVTGAAGQTGAALRAYLDGQLTGTVPCRHDHPQSCGQH
jgi:predicted Fe-Mo cluster-binding NifX family protein